MSGQREGCEFDCCYQGDLGKSGRQRKPLVSIADHFQLLALAVLEGPGSHPSPNHQAHCPPGHRPSTRQWERLAVTLRTPFSQAFPASLQRKQSLSQWDRRRQTITVETGGLRFPLSRRAERVRVFLLLQTHMRAAHTHTFPSVPWQCRPN